uniref:Uncharacterized protein n=1 Tax=Cacopsylla melanoneura TaxID=428564 RepID=A0A8D8T6I1_9HEMI
MVLFRCQYCKIRAIFLSTFQKERYTGEALNVPTFSILPKNVIQSVPAGNFQKKKPEGSYQEYQVIKAEEKEAFRKRSLGMRRKARKSKKEIMKGEKEENVEEAEEEEKLGRRKKR